MRAFMLAGTPTLLCKRSRVDRRRCLEQRIRSPLSRRVYLRITLVRNGARRAAWAQYDAAIHETSGIVARALAHWRGIASHLSRNFALTSGDGWDDVNGTKEVVSKY